MVLLLSTGILARPSASAFANGQSASIVIGQTDFNSQASGTTQSSLSTPEGIAFDSAGNLWVADSANSRVLEFKAPLSSGEAASVELGEPDFTTGFNSCYGSEAINPSCLDVPLYLAFDSSGDLWVSDSLNARIVEFVPPFTNGENASLVIGEPDLFTGPPSFPPPSATNLNNPGGISFDKSGNLWVADTGFNRVLEFKAPFSNGEAASLVIGQDNFTSGVYPNYGPGCQLGLECPTDSSLNSPSGLAIDSSGNLWTTERATGRILEFKSPSSNGESASLVIGQPTFNTWGSAGGFYCSIVTPAQYCVGPDALTFDSSGNMWVADTLNFRVLRFDAPFSNYQNASLVLGQPDYETLASAGQQNATATNLSVPDSVAIDSSGNVWVSDSGQNRVVEYLVSVSGSSSSTTTQNTGGSHSSTTSSAETTTTGGLTSTTTSALTSSSTSVTTSNSKGGGVPEFPFGVAMVSIFTVLIVTSYLVVRHKHGPTVPTSVQNRN